MTSLTPEVFRTHDSRPVIVYAKGRTKLHAIVVKSESVTLELLDNTRGLTPLVTKAGVPYSARKAASFYLNHTWRPITKRAKAVLRGLVSRKRREAA